MSKRVARQTPLTIGALSASTGCNIETIRYYERIGLIPRPARSGGGFRLYWQADTLRLRFLRRARELGFRLDEIRDLLRLADGQGGSCDAVRIVAGRHLASVRARLADLRRMERTLAGLVAQCERGGVPRCPVIETLQRSP